MEGIRILLYHSVGDVHSKDDLGIRVDKDSFRRQMKFLRDENFNVLTLKDAVGCIKRKEFIPQKAVVITFDDGYKDNALIAAPIMEEFDFRAIFFITVNYMGGVKTSPQRDWQRWECMDWDDLKYLIDKGHGIGSHSSCHINLCELPKEEKEEELKSSKERIEASLDKEVDFFCYPYGYFDDELITAVKKSGYKAACTTQTFLKHFRKVFFNGPIGSRRGELVSDKTPPKMRCQDIGVIFLTVD